MAELQGHAIKNKDLMAASGAITLRGTDSLDALAEDEEASRSQLQSQSQAQGVVSADIEQRSREITQIATSISELADLFRDLGGLVVEQGTVLDSVEYNVQMTAKSMEAAVEELTVAKRYQSNTGKRRCILLLILIIVGLIIVLIYKPRRHSAPVDETPAADQTLTTQPGDMTLDVGQSTTSALGGMTLSSFATETFIEVDAPQTTDPVAQEFPGRPSVPVSHYTQPIHY